MRHQTANSRLGQPVQGGATRTWTQMTGTNQIVLDTGGHFIVVLGRPPGGTDLSLTPMKTPVEDVTMSGPCQGDAGCPGGAPGRRYDRRDRAGDDGRRVSYRAFRIPAPDTSEVSQDTGHGETPG